MKPQEPTSPDLPPPGDGWELACEGVLRTQFGRRPSAALANAMAELAREEAGAGASVMTHENARSPLRIEQHPATAARTAPETKASQPGARSGARAGEEMSWGRRWLPRLVWRELHISLRFSLAAAGGVCLALLGLWFYFQSRPAARFTGLEGQVAVERQGKAVLVTAGQALLPQDVIRVAKESGAVLAWKNEGTRIALAGESEFQLLGQARPRTFALQRGKLQAMVAPQRGGHRLTVRTPQAEASVMGTRFSLEVTATATRLVVSQGAVALRKANPASAAEKSPVIVRTGQFAVASVGTPLQAEFITGAASREILAFPSGTPIFGSARGTIVSSELLPRLLISGQSPPLTSSPGSRYEEQIRCYITPRSTGNYSFQIAASQRCEVWLSTDDNPANRQRIISWNAQLASLGGPVIKTNSVGSITRQVPSRTSPPQYLRAGALYYLELRHELKKDDFLLVNWTKPGERAPSPMVDSSVLTPFFEGAPRPVAVGNR
jgi:hypothetical protein